MLWNINKTVKIYIIIAETTPQNIGTKESNKHFIKHKLILLYCIVLYCIVLYCIVLYCIVLYCIVLYCIVLYCIVLYCIVLYCIVLYCNVPCQVYRITLGIQP